MVKYVTLKNVVDTRTGKFHSVAIVSEKKAHFFVPFVEEDEDE